MSSAHQPDATPNITIVDYRKLSDNTLEEIRDASVTLSASDLELVDAELNRRISKQILNHTRYAAFAGAAAAVASTIATLAFIYSIFFL